MRVGEANLQGKRALIMQLQPNWLSGL